MRKRLLVVTSLILLFGATASIAWANSGKTINYLVDLPKQEAEKVYNDVYTETPFIIDPDTGEHLVNPVTGEK
ncbi:hypothetical protein J45TS6_39270 [Paenibacillus sp. J45TS6]|uniref:hypothetical protein n=1 Tax=Paenibacillus sp. J45TS6 TaxID=2807196 RepID=UPI001B289F41|nr:hypothetical protein [Paenibacillus sp. J45TS6]GIP45468.1 hypothetical protein J45TS6_39270 [Paenibacillus sp. J45TS6]